MSATAVTQIPRNVNKKKPDEATQRLRDAIGPLSDVRAPADAEEPILTKTVRTAVLSWLREIDSAADLAAVGVKPRRSAFLFGPPGTGKTTLAWHLSGRLGIPLVSVKAEGLVGPHLGDTGRNIAKLFDTVRRSGARPLLFFDEMDAIGSARSGDDQACSREMNSALTSLLRFIEDFDGLMIAATNRKEAIDQALWRRFDIHLGIDLPGPDERFGILKRYALPYRPTDELLDDLSDLTAGASPSQLRQLMEGVKRLLIVGPRIGFDTAKLVPVITIVVASIQPWAEQVAPPLWEDVGNASMLAGHDWPMARPA